MNIHYDSLISSEAYHTIQQLHQNCFDFDSQPNMNMKGILNIDENGNLRGYLNYHIINEHQGEIYNVCVHPNYRRQGILGILLNELPSNFYYFLQVVFDNRRAYIAYTKYFFCDFIGIGVLTLNSTPSFILGGKRTSESIEHCREKRDKIIEVFNECSTQIKVFEKFNNPFTQMYHHFVLNVDAYVFIYNYWDLISAIIEIDTDKINFSDDISSVIFPFEGSKVINPLLFNPVAKILIELLIKGHMRNIF